MDPRRVVPQRAQPRAQPRRGQAGYEWSRSVPSSLEAPAWPPSSDWAKPRPSGLPQLESALALQFLPDATVRKLKTGVVALPQQLTAALGPDADRRQLAVRPIL